MSEIIIKQQISEDPDVEICPRCKCCELLWHECDNCGGTGYSGHDCGEDCCMCLYPEDNIPCDICGGEGGWVECAGNCDKNGMHHHG